MAANEHKNLTDINRHNPKGFENAVNDTTLSKSAGTSPTGTDGNLVWQDKSLMGATNYKMQGYTTGIANYKYGEDIADTKSPFEMAVDYGNSDVASGSLVPTNLFRIGQGCVIPEIANVVSISGWITSNNETVTTIAICKVTPLEDDLSNIVPVVIDEISVTGLGSNAKLARVNETTITASQLSAGDIIFPMIKETGGTGSTIYINLSIQTTTF
jgi:hypothetical protein